MRANEHKGLKTPISTLLTFSSDQLDLLLFGPPVKRFFSPDVAVCHGLHLTCERCMVCVPGQSVKREAEGYAPEIP
jgi:hypothetical protein